MTGRGGVLGGTGIEVGPVILGAGSIGGFGSSLATRGWGLSAEEGRRQLDAAAARGIRVVDTADAYGGGESERVVGEWLPGHEDVLVATKVGNVVTPAGWASTSLPPGSVRRSAAASPRSAG